MIDLILLAILAAVTWVVANEGAWAAAISLASFLLAGILAMNLFEPVANFLGERVLSAEEWQARWDILALLGLFAGLFLILRKLSLKLMPEHPPLLPLVEQLVRWGCGVAAGYLVMAVTLTALHTAPLPREFLGFTPEGPNFFGTAPDRRWLGFTQHLSETSLKRVQPNGQARLFDGPVSPRIPGDPTTNQIWSSFPIRYAARRERMFGRGSSAGGTSATPSQEQGASSSAADADRDP